MDAPAALTSTASMEIPQSPDNGLGGVDCMDLMETFGYMDLVESNDFFDPSCIFQNEQNQLEDLMCEEHALQEHDRSPAEWLRTNKEIVSAEDLRSMRIKKATICVAAKRLGRSFELQRKDSRDLDNLLSLVC
ncbi:hypothetical protein FH972_019637 [Carpinus fangiana]|uniref:Uncharacterized protein n=1 Tax=Carpinus fangiana TaxID=176857 RepID=A0A5N6RV45_9ROSI|nr:hypothetical protein FH972_019637 [Carpinus fangiana]